MSGQILDENTLESEGNDFDSSSNKSAEEEISIDRLSALPDGILVHILSFLVLGGLEKSVVTSVLSKRWRFLWTELPRLVFIEFSQNSEKRRQFVSKVNRTLLIRTGIHVEKFDVVLTFDESFASDVDSWIDFVLANKVNEVSLRLNAASGIGGGGLYALPEAMFSNSFLTRFSVGRCVLGTLSKIEWPSLTHLRIHDSELPQHVVENILSNCPLLYTLDLDVCWGFNCLDVKSQNLYLLKVHDNTGQLNGDLLEIAAPYLHTLELTFFNKGRKLVLRNIKSLVRAEIDFIRVWATPYDALASTTMELIEILKDVKELRLGKGCFKVLSQLVADGLQLPVSRRNSLTAHAIRGDEHNISGIFALLKSSPNLEGVILTISGACGETWDKAAPRDLDCNLLHLKTVDITDLGDPAFGKELVLTVARTLLMRAKVLEEMKISFRVERRYTDPHGAPAKKRDKKINQALLNYPRSSRKAVVRLCQFKK